LPLIVLSKCFGQFSLCLALGLCCFHIQPLDSTKKWWPLLHTIEMLALLIKLLHWSICSRPLDLGLLKNKPLVYHIMFFQF
jgi:hypothetical protein